MVRYVVLGDEETVGDKTITRFGSFNNKETEEFIQLVVLDKEKNFEWQHTTTLKKEALVQLRDALNIILKKKHGERANANEPLEIEWSDKMNWWKIKENEEVETK